MTGEDIHPIVPEDARASLTEVERARQESAQLALETWWTYALVSVAVGAGVGAVSFRTPAGYIAGGVFLLLVTAGAILVAVRQRRRRRGRILDERVLRDTWWRYAAWYTPLLVLTAIRPDPAWQPWFALVAGVVVASVSYVYLRWTDRYQARRLAAGDYGPYDMV